MARIVAAQCDHTVSWLLRLGGVNATDIHGMSYTIVAQHGNATLGFIAICGFVWSDTMKHHQTLFLSISLSLASVQGAFAWNAAGHQEIGAIADALIAGTPAASHVQEILGGRSLATVSVWPDCARGVVTDDGKVFRYAEDLNRFAECRPFEDRPDDHARFESYVARNWDQCGTAQGSEHCHQQYHYADVAVQRDAYRLGEVGANTHDVVHAIGAAIRVLKGQPAPAPFDIRDSAEALMLLTHFVGDIHQPLHAGAVYLSTDGQLVDPDQATAAVAHDTAGGNRIRSGQTTLHLEWDAIPDSYAIGQRDAPRLLARARTVQPSCGALDDWAATWATESLRAAHDVVVPGQSFSPLPATTAGERSYASSWEVVSRDADYSAREDTLKFSQIAKAGARLAQILLTIWPDATHRATADDGTAECR